jgi:hypothetical protein
MFFDYYEENASIRSTTDALCNACPIQQTCFGWGAAKKETGVWGGIYLTDGKIDDEFNQHKTEQDWRDLWLRLTTLMK